MSKSDKHRWICLKVLAVVDGRDTNEVVKNKSDFNLPIKKDRNGNWKLPSGSSVRVCMASDFFIEGADIWRDEAWDSSAAVPM